MKKGEPQPEPGEIYATIDAEQNFVNFYSVDKPNPHGITLKPLDLKEDGSLVAQDTKHTTTLPLTDIMKCNTVTTRSKRGVKMMLQALTFETDSLFDKTGWGEGDNQINMQQFSVKQMRSHISTKKAKQPNSLKHWDELLPDTTIDWGLRWKTLSHHWIDKKSASIVLKMIHLIKRPQFAVRPHQCPNNSCGQIHNSTYVHACFTCPIAQSVW